MKITESSNGGVSGLTSPQGLNLSSSQSKSRAGAGDPDGDGDHVSLSNLGAALNNDPTQSPARAAHVNSLAALVASGGYTVNAQALSESIISGITRA